MSSLAIGIGDYDHTRDLVSGRVQTPGLAVEWEVVDTPEEIFRRLLAGGDFDAAEMSMAVFTALRDRGDGTFVGLPVFPARSFRHSAIYTRVGGPRTPAELAGVRIGIPAWAQTAGVYARGMLAEEHGVNLERISWVQAGVDAPGRSEPIELDYGGFDVVSAPTTSLNELLLSGEVDAVISARPPACVENGDPSLRRMFEHPQVEADSYRATGIFPIMHLLALRVQAVDEHPHAPRVLFEAFGEAKRRSLRRVAAATVPSLPLPWAAAEARRMRTLLGDDWWPYGVDGNRRTLEAFTRYMHAQRLTGRHLRLNDLFPADLLTAVRST